MHAPSDGGSATRSGCPDHASSSTSTGPVPAHRVGQGRLRRRVVKRGAAVRESTRADVAASDGRGDAGWGSVAAVYSAVLARPVDDPSSTFVSLGGDSLSYVECSLRLERLLGHLPTDWHLLPVGELDAVRETAPAAAARHDGGAAGRCHLRHRVDAHGRLLLPRRRAPAARRRRVQPQSLPAADRQHGGADPRRPTNGRPGGDSNGAVGRRGDAARGYLQCSARCCSSTTTSDRGWHDDGRWHFWFIEVFVHLVRDHRAAAGDPGGATRRTALPVSGSRSRCSWPRSSCAGTGRTWATTTTCASAPMRRLVLRARMARPPFDHVVAAHPDVGVVCDDGPRFLRPSRTRLVHRGRVATAAVGPRACPCRGSAMRPLCAVAGASMWILITHFSVWPVLDRAFARLRHRVSIDDRRRCRRVGRRSSGSPGPAARALRDRRSMRATVHVSPL